MQDKRQKTYFQPDESPSQQPRLFQLAHFEQITPDRLATGDPAQVSQVPGPLTFQVEVEVALSPRQDGPSKLSVTQLHARRLRQEVASSHAPDQESQQVGQGPAQSEQFAQTQLAEPQFPAFKVCPQQQF